MIRLIIEVAQFEIIITGWSEEKPKLYNDGYTAMPWRHLEFWSRKALHYESNDVTILFSTGLLRVYETWKKVNFDFNVSHALLVSGVDRH